MPSAKYTETYKKVSAMGEKLKAAGKQGPSNDEQLHVRLFSRRTSFLPHRRSCLWGKGGYLKPGVGAKCVEWERDGKDK
jgi:hypothetical protein